MRLYRFRAHGQPILGGMVIAVEPGQCDEINLLVLRHAGGGVGTARVIARAYRVFAAGGRDLQPPPETLQALTAPTVPAASGFYDACMKGETRYSLGFFKHGPALQFGHPGSFGAPGTDGAFGYTAAGAAPSAIG
jgi:hypothetical protein